MSKFFKKFQNMNEDFIKETPPINTKLNEIDPRKIKIINEFKEFLETAEYFHQGLFKKILDYIWIFVVAAEGCTCPFDSRLNTYKFINVLDTALELLKVIINSSKVPENNNFRVSQSDVDMADEQAIDRLYKCLLQLQTDLNHLL